MLPTPADSRLRHSLRRKMFLRPEDLQPRQGKTEPLLPASEAEFDRAGIGFQTPGQDIQQRGLSAAVCAAQQNDLASVDFGVDSVQDDMASEALTKMPNAHQWRVGARAPCVVGCKH